MSQSSPDLLKKHFQQLRKCSCEHLWNLEVPRFNQASPKERMLQVSLIRAIGVVFSESGTELQKSFARKWLRSLLEDSQEKIRRYAIQALPKIGATKEEETALLKILRTTHSEREKQTLTATLEHVGGSASLEAKKEGVLGGSSRTQLRLEANIAREEAASAILFEKNLRDLTDITIHLHCRKGLQEILREEIQFVPRAQSKFRVTAVFPEQVALTPTTAFCLQDLLRFRTSGTLAFALGHLDSSDKEPPVEALADLISSSACVRLLKSLTRGPLRYRLEFLFDSARGHGVKALGEALYARNPALLNDPRNAPWEIQIFRAQKQYSVELTPKLRPDPRFAYRTGDVPAASHPPIAAALARVASLQKGEIVWDPFCGSGLELVECALLGGVSRVFGTDLAPDALETTRANLRSALTPSPQTTLACLDFRDHAQLSELRNLSLVITNPPLGKRVRIPNLTRLIEELFNAAAATLKPGGRLVFINPVDLRPKGHSLQLRFRQKIDLGGFFCHLEKYEKTVSKKASPIRETKSVQRPSSAKTHSPKTHLSKRPTPQEELKKKRP